MTKRKSDNNARLQRKKAKLQRQVIHGSHITDTHALHSPYSSPLSLASPERCGKRKRTPDSQSDAFEAPKTKRARSSPCELPDPDSEPWPEVGCNPRKEEPNSTEQKYHRSYEQYASFKEKYEKYDNESADHQNPLPSPGPSDVDASESDEWAFPSVGSIQARHSPQGKRRQSPKKGKIENKRNMRNMPRDEAPLPDVDAFLRSKRSSRRDPNCELWQLGGDGTACTVSRVKCDSFNGGSGTKCESTGGYTR